MTTARRRNYMSGFSGPKGEAYGRYRNNNLKNKEANIKKHS